MSQRFLKTGFILTAVGYVAVVVFVIVLGADRFAHLRSPGLPPEAAVRSVTYNRFLSFTQPVLAMLVGVPAGLLGAYHRRVSAGLAGLFVGVAVTAVGYSLLPTLYFPGGSFSAWGLWLAHLYVYVGAWAVTALLAHLFRRDPVALIASLCFFFAIGTVAAWGVTQYSHLSKHMITTPVDIAAFAAYGRFLRLAQRALAILTGIWAGLLGDHYRRPAYGLVGLALGAAVVAFALSYLPGYHHPDGQALPQQMWLAHLYLAVGAWAVTVHLLFRCGRVRMARRTKT